MWVGPRRGLHEAERRWGIETRSLDILEKDLIASDLAKVVVLRGFDDRVDSMVPRNYGDARLTKDLSALRLVKDEYEIARLQEAVDMTVLGFEDVVRALPTAVGHSERVIEGVFNLRRGRQETTLVTALSPQLARMRQSCTGPAMMARSDSETSYCSTLAWRAKTSTPRT